MKTQSIAISLLSCLSLSQAQSSSAIEELITCDGPCILIDTQSRAFQLFEDNFKAKIGESSTVEILTARDSQSGGKTEERISAKCKVASPDQLSQISAQSSQVLAFFREKKNVTVSRVYVCDASKSNSLPAWINLCSKQSANAVCGPFGSGSAERGLQSIGWGTNPGIWYLALLH
jgi:hypothetical protein